MRIIDEACDGRCSCAVPTARSTLPTPAGLAGARRTIMTTEDTLGVCRGVGAMAMVAPRAPRERKSPAGGGASK